MNRKCFLLLHMLGIALITGACGAADDTTEASTEYVSQGFTVEMSNSETEAASKEDFHFSNSAIQNVTEESLELVKDADIYSKADKSSSQLGSLEKGTKVNVIGKAGKSGWVIVDYNGRAAYIPADCVDDDSLQTVEDEADSTDDNTSDSKKNDNKSSDNKSNSSNSNNSTTTPSNSNSGNTGTTNGGSNSGDKGNSGNSGSTTTPTTPSNGTEKPSETPSESETPSDPETPTEPDTPSEPETPTEPEAPSDTESISTGE